MSNQYYEVSKTVWKAVKASGIMGSGALAAVTFPEEGAGFEQWLLFALTLVPLVYVPLRNWFLHSHKPTKKAAAEFIKYIYPGCIVFMLCGSLVFLSSGCTSFGQSRVSTLFEESVTPEGVATTKFKADSRGEVDTSLHQMNYRWGGEENEIIIGQEGSGVTSPAQQAFVNGLASLIANVPGMWESLMDAVSRPVPAPGAP